MMIQKARLFGDEVRSGCKQPRFGAENVKDIAQQMMQTTIPKEHQALGRKAKGFDRKKWDERKQFSELPLVRCMLY